MLYPGASQHPLLTLCVVLTKQALHLLGRHVNQEDFCRILPSGLTPLST